MFNFPLPAKLSKILENFIFLIFHEKIKDFKLLFQLKNNPFLRSICDKKIQSYNLPKLINKGIHYELIENYE